MAVCIAAETIITICHWIFARQIACLSDNNEVWSDKLSDQRIRRKPKGIELMDCQSDHECQINFVYGLM